MWSRTPSASLTIVGFRTAWPSSGSAGRPPRDEDSRRRTPQFVVLGGRHVSCSDVAGQIGATVEHPGRRDESPVRELCCHLEQRLVVTMRVPASEDVVTVLSPGSGSRLQSRRRARVVLPPAQGSDADRGLRRGDRSGPRVNDLLPLARHHREPWLGWHGPHREADEPRIADRFPSQPQGAGGASAGRGQLVRR